MRLDRLTRLVLSSKLTPRLQNEGSAAGASKVYFPAGIKSDRGSPTFVMAKTYISRSWLFCASGLLLIAAGCAQPTATVPVVAPPIPSGQARVWFYRPWEPSESLDLALIDMNGSYVGAAENGSAF